MPAVSVSAIRTWLKHNRPVLDELLGPWSERRGFAWEHAAAFIAWAMEERFGITRGVHNHLAIYEAYLEETGQRFHPTINFVQGRPLVTGDEAWMTTRVCYMEVDLKDFEWWIVRCGPEGAEDKIIGSLLPWEPDPRTRSESGTGDEFWSDIVAAARQLAYPFGRPMVHGLWTVRAALGGQPQIVPDEGAIAALAMTYPSILARMT